jgi:hypothetical protein
VNAASAAPRAGEVRFRHQDQPEGGELEPGAALSHEHAEPLGAPERGLGPRLELVLGEDPAEPRRLARVARGEPHAEPFDTPPLDLPGQRLELPAEAPERPHVGPQSRISGPAGGQQRQLQALEAVQEVRERRRGGRVVRRRLEQAWVLQHDEGVRREVGGECGRRGRRGARERQDVHAAERLEGALRGGVEQAQRLHVVSHELDPHGPRMGRAEDVHDPAAHAPLPDLHHGLHALVAGHRQPRDERLAVERLAQGQREGAGLERLGRHQRNAERRGRRDHRGRLAHREPSAGERPLAVLLAPAAAGPARRRPRELHHAPLGSGRGLLPSAGPRRHGSQEEPEVQGGPVPLPRAGRQHEEGPAQLLEHGRQHQGPACPPEPVHFETRHAPREGGDQLLERRPPREIRGNRCNAHDEMGGASGRTDTTAPAARQTRGA